MAYITRGLYHIRGWGQALCYMSHLFYNNSSLCFCVTLPIRWRIGDMMYEWPRWQYCFNQGQQLQSQNCGVESGNVTYWFRADKNTFPPTFLLHYLPWCLINWGEYSAGVRSEASCSLLSSFLSFFFQSGLSAVRACQVSVKLSQCQLIMCAPTERDICPHMGTDWFIYN